MSSFSFPKCQRILKQRHFRIVSKYGVRVSGHLLAVSLLINSKKKEQKLGITVSKKFGKANKRNYFKRIIREAFRLNKFRLPLAYLVVFPVSQTKDKKLSLNKVSEELINLASSAASKRQEEKETS